MNFFNSTGVSHDVSLAQESLQKILSQSLPFTHVFENAFFDECTAVLEQIKHFDHLLVLGIGGSALGMQAILQALNKGKNVAVFGTKGVSGNPQSSKKITVLDTIDPEVIEQTLSCINWETTVVNVISKSGGTLETALQLSVVESILRQKFSQEEMAERVVCTTETGSMLFDHARKNNYLTLPVPKSIGGRFSVFTPVGVLPLLFAGIDMKTLLSSAQKSVESTDAQKLVCDLVASQFHAYKHENRNLTVFMTYQRKLMGLLFWYRQILAESLGKDENTGITPVLALGSTDQHSQVQLYAEGPQDKLIVFLSAPFQKDPQTFSVLGFEKEIGIAETQEALLFGTKKSLEIHNRPFVELSFIDVNEKEVGEFLMVHMLVIAVMGDLLKINAYDQPGVEEGKIQSKKFLMN